MNDRKSSFGISLAAFLTVLVSPLASAAWADDCNKARDYYQKGVGLLNYDERRAAFQKAVENCPSYAEAYINLADALENLGLLRKKFDERNLAASTKLLDEAVRNYEKALKLNSKLWPAHLGLGEIYLGRGSYGMARDQFEQVLKIEPSNESATDGLKKAKDFLARESDGLKKSSRIVQEATESADTNGLKTMGFEDHTVKDRQSFNNILFKGYSAEILPGEPLEQLNEIGMALSSPDMGSYKFVVEGHANKVDTHELNMKLSSERAKEVKEYLVKKFQISPDRLLTQGFGYTRPKLTPETHAGNRRVEILFFHENGKE